VDDMKDSQVNAIYNNIVNRKESDSNVVYVPQYSRTKPSIVYVNGEKYMLKDNGEYELIEYDYE
jgi:translation elongation factor P/translation initiation factor 5A